MVSGTLNIRLPTGRVIRYADEKAALFFVTDVAAVGPHSYDAYLSSPSNPPNAFIPADIRAINTTMRARSSAKHWTQFTTGRDLPWLRAIEPTWDLVETSDDDWTRYGCASAIHSALVQLMGPYRQASVVTKLLHIKRPRLVPICDSYVSAAVGKVAVGPEATTSLILAIRNLGRDNMETLEAISSRLGSVGIVRSPVRVLDAVLWSGAFTGGLYGLFEDWLVKWHGGRLFF
jgi:uncharacterized protein DUF6308